MSSVASLEHPWEQIAVDVGERDAGTWVDGLLETRPEQSPPASPTDVARTWLRAAGRYASWTGQVPSDETDGADPRWLAELPSGTRRQRYLQAPPKRMLYALGEPVEAGLRRDRAPLLGLVDLSAASVTAVPAPPSTYDGREKPSWLMPTYALAVDSRTKRARARVAVLETDPLAQGHDAATLEAFGVQVVKDRDALFDAVYGTAFGEFVGPVIDRYHELAAPHARLARKAVIASWAVGLVHPSFGRFEAAVAANAANDTDETRRQLAEAAREASGMASDVHRMLQRHGNTGALQFAEVASALHPEITAPQASRACCSSHDGDLSDACNTCPVLRAYKPGRPGARLTDPTKSYDARLAKHFLISAETPHTRGPGHASSPG